MKYLAILAVTLISCKSEPAPTPEPKYCKCGEVILMGHTLRGGDTISYNYTIKNDCSGNIWEVANKTELELNGNRLCLYKEW